MVKIGIIEDNESDANKRYGFLNKNGHDIHISLINAPQRARKYSLAQLKERGFDPDKIYFDLEEMPEADIYFCDGLEGKCFEVADKFGKDRTFIYTCSNSLQQKAENRKHRLQCLKESTRSYCQI